MIKNQERPAVLITAGPTREAIDPVRYITNHSSGKMGYAIAEAFLDRGYEVILISGPVSLTLLHPHLTIVPVVSADEMFEVCRKWFDRIRIAVFAAAVADYKPAFVHNEKIKKADDAFSLEMVKNVDIAREFGKVKSKGQVSVGFALETNNGFQHALKKLGEKNFDLIVLNSVRDEQAAFGYDTNKVTIINEDHISRTFPLKSKKLVGVDIAAEAIGLSQKINKKTLSKYPHKKPLL